MDAFLIFSAVLVVAAVLLVYAGVKTVPQGQHWTVLRFGQYTRTLQPGLQLIIPFVDTIGSRMSVMEGVLDIPRQTVISSDNANVEADAVAFYRVDDVAKASYQIQKVSQAITNLAMTNLRSVLGSMQVDEMLSKREEINARIQAAMDAATTPWGVKVTRVEIKDLALSPELQKAMNMQMTAERHRRAVVTQASGDREAEIARAEGQKQAAILRAQGEREAAFLQSEAREREAQAEAKATLEVSQAIASGEKAALQYFLGLKYVEALKEIGAASNSKLVMMPLDAAGVTGAVGGIAELIKDVGAHASGVKG